VEGTRLARYLVRTPTRSSDAVAVCGLVAEAAIDLARTKEAQLCGLLDVAADVENAVQQNCRRRRKRPERIAKPGCADAYPP